MWIDANPTTSKQNLNVYILIVYYRRGRGEYNQRRGYNEVNIFLLFYHVLVVLTTPRPARPQKSDVLLFKICLKK